MTTSLQRPKFWFLGTLLALFLLGFVAVNRGDAAGPTASASGAKTVSIVNFAFKPGTLTVKRGASVGFSNTTSGTTHTATSASFDTKNIAPGTTKTVHFSKKGTFAFHCKIHPFMKGKIVVE
jgi:plastocyanin